MFETSDGAPLRLERGAAQLQILDLDHDDDNEDGQTWPSTPQRSLKKRKLDMDLADSGPGICSNVGSSENSDEIEIFFRVSHTQLGRHKFFEKGSLTTHDLGIQIIPCQSCVRGDSGVETATLNLSLTGASGVTDEGQRIQAATWMSETAISADELQTHWKVWKLAGKPMLNVESVKLKHFVGNDVEPANLAAYQQIILDMVDAKAFPGCHVFVPSPDDTNHIMALQFAGVVSSQHGGGPGFV